MDNNIFLNRLRLVDEPDLLEKLVCHMQKSVQEDELEDFNFAVETRFGELQEKTLRAGNLEHHRSKRY
ncbi:hypothetical protein MUA04_00660 [Enterobacteriaceae bacterium H11S18]|uniref:hypothetical protein n=1 Tax=Dryocola clanedunensis TaxID=2925396 RepID=UPI0022F06187|nr:hypothetical protein [Dryocola clanedunensis]MCT4708334.1 hypothetical protein [Dryocola clanedunensis]MCT4708749.1 hypothetical protein [Dryocola clanedunensis]